MGTRVQRTPPRPFQYSAGSRPPPTGPDEPGGIFGARPERFGRRRSPPASARSSRSLSLEPQTPKPDLGFAHPFLPRPITHNPSPITARPSPTFPISQFSPFPVFPSKPELSSTLAPPLLALPNAPDSRRPVPSPLPREPLPPAVICHLSLYPPAVGAAPS